MMHIVRALFTIKRSGVYHVPGKKTAVFKCTKAEYDQRVSLNQVVLLGITREKEPEQEEKEPESDDGQEDGGKKKAEVLVDPADGEPLPGGFSFEKALRAGGLTTLEAIRSFPDLTKISGIGPPEAATIQAELAKLDEADEEGED